MLYEPKVKIILHGYLKELYPHEISLSGTSVATILNGLCKVTKQAFFPKLGEGKHRMRVVGFETQESLYADLTPATKELHIVPDMSGGKGGLFQIIIGIIMIICIIIFPASAAAFAAAIGTTTGSLLLTGASLILGGLMSALSPAPKMDSFGNQAADPEASKYLGATANTVKIGTRIPIAYGTTKIYGQYLSFDVDAMDVAV